MTYRTRNIALAIVLALVAAALTSYYVTAYKRQVQQSEADVQVYVAAKDIPAGLTGEQALDDQLLQARDVARRTVVPGAISNPEQLRGHVAVQTTFAGEQISLRRFGDVAQQGVVGAIAGTQRAIQLAGDGNQLLAGTLRDGDRVDVVASIPTEGNDHATRIVLRNLKVLEAPETPAAGKLASAESTQTSALIALHDTQVQRLFWVAKNADWSLQLRPAVDAADGADVVETGRTVVQGRRR